MKLLTKSVAILATATALYGEPSPPSALKPAGNSNRIVATVNGRPILESEMNERLRVEFMIDREEANRTGGPVPTDRAAYEAKLKKEALDYLVERELILKEYEPYRAGFDRKVETHAEEVVKGQFVGRMFKGDREQFLKELKSSGISYKRFFEQQKKDVILQMMRGQFARPDQEYITEEDKASYLKKHGDDFRTGAKLKLWSIAVAGDAEGSTPTSQQRLAKEVRARLAKGDDFASLAKTYSSDSKKADGGSWGWVEQKDLSAQIWRLVSRIQPKTVSEVIPFSGNFYIFWVEAAQPGVMRPDAEVSTEVEARIKAEQRKKASDEWIAKLRKKAVIELP